MQQKIRSLTNVKLRIIFCCVLSDIDTVEVFYCFFFQFFQSFCNSTVRLKAELFGNFFLCFMLHSHPAYFLICFIKRVNKSFCDIHNIKI